jgi:Tol biopolymer transport system component
VALSPDEKYIAIERRDPDSGSYDVWLADPIKNTNTRLTFEDSSERSPVWLPDGQHLVFSSDRSGFELMRVAIDSTAKPEVLFKSDVIYRPMDFTSKNILLLRDDGRSFFTLTPGGSPEVFLQTAYVKSGGRLSPNGKWLAFSSSDSGRDEVYVTPFPMADRRQQISTGGGVQPMWNSTGSEMFYLDPQGRVMAVSVDEQVVTTRIPRILFDTKIVPGSGLNQYAVNGKGSRFLIIRPVSEEQVSPIDVIVNWSGNR